MSLRSDNPDLIIGVGGVGSQLAQDAGRMSGCDTLLISHDQRDLAGDNSILISTESAINPSVHLLRGFAFKAQQKIKDATEGCSSVVMFCNLAGKGGSAIAPAVSHMLGGKRLACFAIMPFQYETSRLFTASIALQRVRDDSDFVIVADNDAVLDANPSITPNQCYKNINSAILQVASSLDWSESGIIFAGRNNPDVEGSLRDSLKTLYGSTTPDRVRRAAILVMGGNNIPLGDIRSIKEMTTDAIGTEVEVSTNTSDKSGIAMVSAIEGEMHFDQYDPLRIIPTRLDWDEPDYAMDCGLNMHNID